MKFMTGAKRKLFRISKYKTMGEVCEKKAVCFFGVNVAFKNKAGGNV